MLRGFWIIKDPDLDVALELATGGSKACNRKVEVQRYAAKDVGCAYGPAQVTADGLDESNVHNRRARKSSKEVRAAVSDRDRGVRSRGERPPPRGAPNNRR